MFKKIISLSFALLGISNLHATDVLVEAKGAYFLPTDQKFQKIYSGGGIYGGEITCQVCHDVYGWVSGDYFSKDGRSIGEHDSTRITLVPIGVGLKYLYPIECADLYFGAGVLGTYLHIHDHSPYVIQSISKWGAGCIAKVGAIINIYEQIFTDLFTSYSYTEMGFDRTEGGKVTRHNAHLGGFAFGIGIGYRFD